MLALQVTVTFECWERGRGKSRGWFRVESSTKGRGLCTVGWWGKEASLLMLKKKGLRTATKVGMLG